MDPATLAMIAKFGVPAVGRFFSSLFGSQQQSKEKAKDRQLDRDLQTQRLQEDESKLDPWRDLMSQVGDSSKLDRVANAQYAPVTLTPGAGGMISRSGGATYTKSPELIAAAKRAAQMILSGGGQNASTTGMGNVRGVPGLGGPYDVNGAGMPPGAQPRRPPLRPQTDPSDPWAL